jgi:hypothetical protein
MIIQLKRKKAHSEQNQPGSVSPYPTQQCRYQQLLAEVLLPRSLEEVTLTLSRYYYKMGNEGL